MAEAFLNAACGSRFKAFSAGLTPGKLNPIVVEAMRLRGIDISRQSTKSVDDMLASELKFEYVITVCDEASAEKCPVFPGATKRLHWGFPDPSALAGDDREKLANTIQIRDAIEARVKSWCSEVCR
jgi:arsenate reductase